jgi:F-type H+-transporting ATPase subunit delta
VAGKDELIHGYAQGLFSVIDAEEAMGSVEDELFAFAKALEQNTPLREALTDPALPAENKGAVIDELLTERAHPMTATIVRFVVETGRARELGSILQELAAVAAERRQHQVAEVRSAVPLTDEQRRRIEAALAKATGRSIEVKVVVDPTVVGGVVARVGDEVFDGSVRTRLADARQRLGSG